MPSREGIKKKKEDCKQSTPKGKANGDVHAIVKKDTYYLLNNFLYRQNPNHVHDFPYSTSHLAQRKESDLAQKKNFFKLQKKNWKFSELLKGLFLEIPIQFQTETNGCTTYF